MKDNTYKSDCTITCVDGDIQCHSIYLILHSDYFDAYFNRNFGDSCSTLELPCTMKALQIVINYVYGTYHTDRTEYDGNDYIQALEICDMYLFDEHVTDRIKKRYKYLFESSGRQGDMYIPYVDELKDIDYYDLWKPSTYCRNGQLLYDSKVRSSYSFNCADFEPSADMDNMIYNNDANRDYDFFECKFTKILKYLPGSEFTEHIDRSKLYDGNYSCGKLLFIRFSADAIGGELIVEGVSVITTHNGTEKWLFYYMPHGVKHQVSKLKQGCRYTICIPTFKEGYDDEQSDQYDSVNEDDHGSD